MTATNGHNEDVTNKEEKESSVAKPVFGKPLVLLCSIMTFGFGTGIPASLSVMFLDWQHAFGATRTHTATIHSLCFGLVLGGSVIVGLVMKRIGARWTILIGSLLASLGLFVSAFATSINFLVITMGGMTGVGFSLVQLPCIPCLTAVITHYQTVSISLCVFATAIFSTINRFFLRWLIFHYSWRGACIVLAGVTLNTSLTGMIITSLLPRCREIVIVLDEDEDIPKTKTNKDGDSRSRQISEGIENENLLRSGLLQQDNHCKDKEKSSAFNENGNTDDNEDDIDSDLKVCDKVDSSCDKFSFQKDLSTDIEQRRSDNFEIGHENQCVNCLKNEKCVQCVHYVQETSEDAPLLNAISFIDNTDDRKNVGIQDDLGKDESILNQNKALSDSDYKTIVCDVSVDINTQYDAINTAVNCKHNLHSGANSKTENIDNIISNNNNNSNNDNINNFNNNNDNYNNIEDENTIFIDITNQKKNILVDNREALCSQNTNMKFHVCINGKWRFLLDRMFLLLSLHIAVCTASIYSFYLFQMDFAYSLGFGESTGVLFLTVVTVSSIIGRLGISIGDLFPRIHSFVIQIAYAVPGCIAFFILSCVTDHNVIVCLLVVVGISTGGLVAIYPKCALDVKSVTKDVYPVVLGFFFTVEGVMGIVITIVIGYSVDQTGSYTLILIVMGSIGLVTTVLLLIGFLIPNRTK